MRPPRLVALESSGANSSGLTEAMRRLQAALMCGIYLGRDGIVYRSLGFISLMHNAARINSALAANAINLTLSVIG